MRKSSIPSFIQLIYQDDTGMYVVRIIFSIILYLIRFSGKSVK